MQHYTAFVCASVGQWSTESYLSPEQRKARLFDPELIAHIREDPDDDRDHNELVRILNRGDFGARGDGDLYLKVVYMPVGTVVNVVVKTNGRFTGEIVAPVAPPELTYTA